jgi:hypothetical protein
MSFYDIIYTKPRPMVTEMRQEDLRAMMRDALIEFQADKLQSLVRQAVAEELNAHAKRAIAEVAAGKKLPP